MNTKLFSLLRNTRFWLSISAFYYILISSVYALMSIVKHRHYETFADLGIFNQGIWQYSRFQWPYITFHLHRPFLGDHFHPILMILAPFYWLMSSEETLLFLQPFIILSAIIPLYLIGLKLTKSIFFTLSIILAYSFYIPLQYTIFYDFHEIVFLPPLFAWAYYFYISQRKILVSIFFILLLLTKEEVGFFIATFGLFLLIFSKGWRMFGIVWLFLGSLYSLVAMYWIIPAIGGNYLYFNYGDSGATPIDVVVNVFHKPIQLVNLFFNSPIKRDALLQTFWPFGFLPLLSPMGVLLSFEQFFSRFLHLNGIVRWTIGYHYSAPMTIILPIATIWSAHFYSKFFPKYKGVLLVVIGISLIALTRVEQINTSAVLLIKRPQFWQRDIKLESIDQAIRLLPKDVSVASQNNIIPHISTRKNVFSLQDYEQAEYILIDFNKGQSGYNFFGEEKKTQVEKELKSKIQEGVYEVVYNQEETFLLKRK